MSTMIGPAELEIVSKLLEGRYSRLDALAAELNRSERSLRYSLDKLNEFFQKHYGGNLVAMEGQQQLELLKSTDAIVKAMGKISKNHYYMSMEERVELTSFQYLAGFNFTIDELADFMNISISTLKQSMPMVRERLSEYNISLVNVHRIE
jgi:mannitol operon transcriptional antiterminator